MRLSEIIDLQEQAFKEFNHDPLEKDLAHNLMYVFMGVVARHGPVVEVDMTHDQVVQRWMAKLAKKE